MLSVFCVNRRLCHLQALGCVWILVFMTYSIGIYAHRVYSQDLATNPTDVGRVTSQVVETLSKQLDATKESERDAAEKALWELGPDALDFLPPISEALSAEQQMRIERLREKLHAERTMDVQEPRRVTVIGRMSAYKALELIASQSRNRIPLNRFRSVEEFSVENEYAIEEMRYWEAVDRILLGAGWRIEPLTVDNDQFASKGERSDDDVAVIPEAVIPEAVVPEEVIPGVEYVGVLRIEPLTVTRTMGVHRVALQRSSLELLVHWESRIKPMYIGFDFPSHRIETDDNQVLTVRGGVASESMPAGSQMVANLEFTSPTGRGVTITEWAGQIKMVIPGRLGTVEFSDLDGEEVQALEVRDMRVELESAKKNRDIYEIKLGLSLKSQPNEEILQGWILQGNAYLVDSEGKRVEHAGWSTHRWDAKEIGVSFLFDIEGELSDYRLVVQAPESVIEQTLDYTLRNIPLP